MFERPSERGEGKIRHGETERAEKRIGFSFFVFHFAVFIAALWARPGVGQDSASGVVWSETHDFRGAPPAAVDFNLDGIYEIVLTNNNNRVRVVNAETGDRIWETAVDADGKLDLNPAWGHFVGDGTIDLLLLSSAGAMVLLDGTTGEVLLNFDLNQESPMPPAAAPLPAEEGAPAPYRDGALIVGRTGNLTAYRINARRSPDVYYHFQFDGIVKNPPAVGLTGAPFDGPHVVAVNNVGQVYVLSVRPGASDVMTYKLPYPRITDTDFALGDVDGDGRDEIVVADGQLHLYALDATENGIAELWRADGIPTPTRSPVTIDADGDGRDDVLLPYSGRYSLLSGADGQKSIWAGRKDYNHDGTFASPPAVFYGADGGAFAAFSDNKGRVMAIDLSRQPGLDSQFRRAIVDTDAPTRTTPLVGPLGGGGSAQMFTLGASDGEAVLTDLGIGWAEKSAPWFGERGGPRRASHLSSAYREYLAAQAEALTANLEENVRLAREYAERGEWASAIEQAREALAANPRHEEAQSILRRATIRQNLMAIVLGALVGAALLALALWFGSRWGLRRARLSMAGRALAAEDLERAAAYMLAVHRSAPRHREHLKTLADLYVKLKKFDGETAEIFEKATEAFPDDERYIKALATAYSSAQRCDRAAARAYRNMVRVSTHPGPWAFVLGRTLFEIGDYREAHEAFQKALLHHFDDPSMPKYLADLYVKLDIVKPDLLGTLTRVLDERRNDRAFLKLYCRTCRKARDYEESAQKAARWLLELEPDAPEAHTILASALLKGGEVKEAMQHAQKILEGDANDSIGLRLLGACYAAENRLDETAMTIFNRALAANPEANEILLAVSHGYIQQGREDDEATAIYRRALKGNPKEETILSHLAGIASRRSDDDLTIRSVEALLELGHRSRELVLQLAEAYCRKNVLKAEAAPIYREALLFQPDHATIADNLATIYMREKKTDSEAREVYEKVFERNPKRLDVGRQLARAYHAADMEEQALALARRLIEAEPDDSEMRKLAAHASASLDQMESAIQGFEQIVEENPDDRESVARLAMLYGRRRQFDAKAMKIYRRAVRNEPDNLEIHAALARACVAEKNWEQAVATIKHLLTHAPGKVIQATNLMAELVDNTAQSMELRQFLIDTLIFSGQHRDAIKHIVDALRIDSGLGRRAVESLDKILDKNPKEPRAHHQKGRILASLGREHEARQALEQAHRHNPNDESMVKDLMAIYQRILDKRETTDMRFQLGRLALQVGKYDLAISCFQKTDKDYRWESESIRLLARCFMAKGMLDLALQELRRLPIDDEVKDILYELGQRYESVNDKAGAREVYKAIFAVDIGYKDVQGKLEGLAEDQDDRVTAERTAILNSLSEKAKTRYELVQELGRGAMGIVYKARDNELDEMVALKLMPETLNANDEALRRFRQEARNARRLSHPNIVRIHDIGEEMGRKYISMEFVNGTDLRQRLIQAKRRLPFPEILHYSKQICEAMAAAHDVGIVHRDIKPANIMLTQTKKVKVTDFGIAKMVEEEPRPDATRAGAVIGTPLYMSPEQVKGSPVDHRADIYSIGILFYEMASGTPPFIEGDLAYHHVFTAPKPIEREDVPEAYRRIAMKCIAKKPEERFQSAREIMAELGKIECEEFDPLAGE